MAYLPRIADHILKEYLEAFGAVLIEGPKWCAKRLQPNNKPIAN